MEKIININYKGTLIPIGEGAYQKFVQYQDELKQFLNKEADADEVFEDLQFRMYEILKSRLSAAHSFVGEADVEEVIAVIGRPHDLYEAAGDEKLNPAERVQETNYMEQSKLRRDRTGKFISGLCSGIANFLGMDPLALRLIVIMLFIITPLPTLVIYALGYIIPEEPLLPNTSRKLYRNPKDKILGVYVAAWLLCSERKHGYSVSYFCCLFSSALFMMENLIGSVALSEGRQLSLT